MTTPCNKDYTILFWPHFCCYSINLRVPQKYNFFDVIKLKKILIMWNLVLIYFSKYCLWKWLNDFIFLITRIFSQLFLIAKILSNLTKSVNIHATLFFCLQGCKVAMYLPKLLFPKSQCRKYLSMNYICYHHNITRNKEQITKRLFVNATYKYLPDLLQIIKWLEIWYS